MSSSSGESDEEDYEVDKITGHKRQDGEYVYKVRWKNYGKDQDTWEPQSNLDNCQQAIDEYWRRRNAEKEKKRQEDEGTAGGAVMPLTPPSTTAAPAKTLDKALKKPSAESKPKSIDESDKKESSPRKENLGDETKSPFTNFPIASSAEKTESWAADTVKFTTGMDVECVKAKEIKKDPVAKTGTDIKLQSDGKSKPSVPDTSDAGSVTSSKASKPVEQKPKLITADAPTIAQQKKKAPAVASALDSAAAGGGGESWKQKYENKKKEYEKLQKSYEKVNQENAAMKSKIEKVVSKEIKAVEVDTADLYSNGQQAFIKSAKKPKLITTDAPIIAQQKKKAAAVASALDSAAAGGGGGESWKQKYEKKKKEYEKLQKSYQKVNQENAAMKSKIEKVVSKEIKAVEVDTADLYSNGQQAFIETQRQSCEVLWEAVKNGQYNVVQEAVFNMALKETTSFLWDSQRNGKTMLGLAVEKHDEDMVRLLLSAPGLDANARTGEDQSTALIQACDMGLVNIASLLLEGGAHVNRISVVNGESALMKASKNGHEDIVGLLLEYCADTNLKTEQNQIAQQMARLKNHQICVKSIEQHYSWVKNCIDEKIKLYLRDAFELGNTPLFPMHCHSLKDGTQASYTVDMTNTTAVAAASSGFLLFLTHCKIEPRRNNIMARLHGPCFVQQVRVNNQILTAPVPGANFILGFIPKCGKNQLHITMTNAPWSDTHIVFCAYAVTKKKSTAATAGAFSTVAAMGQSFRSTLPK